MTEAVAEVRWWRYPVLVIIRGIMVPLTKIETFRARQMETFKGKLGVLWYWIALCFMLWELYAIRSQVWQSVVDIVEVAYASSYAPWVVTTFLLLAMVKIFFTYARKLLNTLRKTERRLTAT